MKTIIVDDEPLARGIVREYLSSHADVQIVAECGNGFEAVKAIAELAPDLVILDIQMPKLDGFEVLELVGTRGPRFIFATAFDGYAIRAFEVRALDYLLKPFSQQRFDQALENARAAIAAAAPTGALENLGRAAVLRERPVGRVLIRDGAKVHVIACERIDCVQAQDDYVEIRAEGRAYLKNQPLSELESQLDPARFLRIHRSWLVNIEAVSRIEQVTRDSHVAMLKDGSRVPVSRSGYQKLRTAME